MNSHLRTLCRVEWRLQRGNLLLAGLLFAISSLVLSSILLSVDAVSTLRLQMLSGSSDLILRVRPPEPKGPVSFARPMLEDDDIAALQSLPGLGSLTVISGLPIPASMRVRIPRIIDSRYDVTLYTLSDDAVPHDLQQRWHTHQQGKSDTVPMILNPQLLTLYNLGFADRYRTPRLRQEALQDLQLPLSIGRDLFGSLPQTIEHHRGQVIGFSNDLPVWGAGIPASYADKWLPVLYPDAPPEGIGPVLVTLRFDDLAAMVRAQDRIHNRGLSIDGDSSLAEAILQDRQVARGISLIILTLIAAILLWSMSALSAAQVHQRRLTLALCRSLGAKPWHLAVMLGSGPLCAAGCGAFLGAVAAQFLSPYLASQAASLMEVGAVSIAWAWNHLLWAPLFAMAVVSLGVCLALMAALRKDILRELRDY